MGLVSNFGARQAPQLQPAMNLFMALVSGVTFGDEIECE